MNDYNGNCRAELSSVTTALKAQRALSAAAIPSNVIKIESSSSRRGCAYGIEFACNQMNNVRTVLSGAGVAVKKWNSTD